jgi:lipid-A-disaccharide synthase-like uncharacterized protein
MHQVKLTTFGDVASFVSIIGGLLSITYFMIRNVTLEVLAVVVGQQPSDLHQSG